MNNQTIVRNIEAIAGLPKKITYPVINKLSHALMPLHERVTAKLLDSANGELWEDISTLDSLGKKREFIKAAVHFMPVETRDICGLSGIKPPDSIHRMQKTDPHWIGDLFSANMVVHSLNDCNLDQDNQAVLDLGCSSGSLVRVLAAYNTSWSLHGCDPIDSAIDWASENISTCDFRKMSNNPPLPYNDELFDGVCAISVWSHHRKDAAQNWIDETARILKTGGWFALSFSTLHHLRWRAKNDRISEEQADQMLNNFANTGNHFVPINYNGEDNLTDSNWGQSAYSREMFFSMFVNSFDVMGYYPGLNQGNQDFAVFQKR